MWKGTLQNFGKLSSLTGLEIHTSKSGEFALQACTIRLAKQELIFELAKADLKSVLHLSKHDQAGPIALCLTGKGVITKQIELVAVLDAQVINQVLPNANPDLFYFQHYNDATHSWISAIRRSEADEWLSQLKEHGFEVLALSLDRFPLEGVLKPAVEQLDERLWLAYASAFQVLLQQDLVTVKHNGLERERKQAFARSQVLAVGRVFGLALLVLLLINFALFSYYSDELNKLSTQSNTTAAEVGKLKQMESDIYQKTAFITQAGWTGGLNYAYLTDQLLSCMPAKITLQEFAINPLNEALSKNKHEDLYETKTVRISGTCLDAGMLNNWIFAIKAKDWVSGCKILNYAINPDDGAALFAISIQLQGL